MSNLIPAYVYFSVKVEGRAKPLYSRAFKHPGLPADTTALHLPNPNGPVLDLYKAYNPVLRQAELVYYEVNYLSGDSDPRKERTMSNAELEAEIYAPLLLLGGFTDITAGHK